MPEPRAIVKALIRLNFLENESGFLGDRSKRKAELLAAIEKERAVVPGPILAHHARLRGRGRDSTAPVREWICRACFIAVPSGMRTHLAQRDDLHVCQNCGSYSYISDGTEDYPDEVQLMNAARRRVLKTEAKARPGGKRKATVKPVAGKGKKQAVPRSLKSKPRKAVSFLKKQGLKD